jgi:hypothetical protein
MPEHVHRLQRVPERRAPAAAVADPMPQAERRECSDEPERHRDRPREGEAEAGARRAAREDDHSRKRCDRREHGVLEGTEPEHADACLTRIEAGILERMPVDGEPAANDEDAEAGRHDRAGAPKAKTRPTLCARQLAVRDDVAEVRGELHRERDRQPVGVRGTELAQDRAEAGRPGDTGHRSQGEARTEEHEQRMLRRVALQMGGRPQESPKSHPHRIGRTGGSLNPVVVPVAPHTPHGEA